MAKNGNKKHGRNSDVCKRYKAEGRRDKARIRRMRRHLEKFPDDRVTVHALANLIREVTPAKAEKLAA